MSKIKTLSLQMDNGVTATMERQKNNEVGSESVKISFSGPSDLMVKHETASIEHLINFLFGCNF